MSTGDRLTPSVRIEYQVRFGRSSRGRKELLIGPEAATAEAGAAAAASRLQLGHVPRVSRLMALALRFQRLVESGEVRDYAELARLGHVSRARVTQIMNLLGLAPDIQEALLFLPTVERGRDPIKEWMVRPIAATPDWRKQRRLWSDLSSNLPS